MMLESKNDSLDLLTRSQDLQFFREKIEFSDFIRVSISLKIDFLDLKNANFIL